MLASRTAVPLAVLECYRPLFRSLSWEQFEGSALPALLRVVKRLPDIMLPVMEAVFEMLDGEVTAQAGAIVKELLPQLRHVKETVR